MNSLTVVLGQQFAVRRSFAGGNGGAITCCAENCRRFDTLDTCGLGAAEFLVAVTLLRASAVRVCKCLLVTIRECSWRSSLTFLIWTRGEGSVVLTIARSELTRGIGVIAIVIIGIVIIRSVIVVCTLVVARWICSVSGAQMISVCGK